MQQAICKTLFTCKLSRPCFLRYSNTPRKVHNLYKSLRKIINQINFFLYWEAISNSGPFFFYWINFLRCLFVRILFPWEELTLQNSCFYVICEMIIIEQTLIYFKGIQNILLYIYLGRERERSVILKIDWGSSIEDHIWNNEIF